MQTMHDPAYTVLSSRRTKRTDRQRVVKDDKSTDGLRWRNFWRPRIWDEFQVAGTNRALCGFNRDERAGVVQYNRNGRYARACRRLTAASDHLFLGA